MEVKEQPPAKEKPPVKEKPSASAAVGEPTEFDDMSLGDLQTELTKAETRVLGLKKAIDKKSVASCEVASTYPRSWFGVQLSLCELH